MASEEFNGKPRALTGKSTQSRHIVNFKFCRFWRSDEMPYIMPTANAMAAKTMVMTVLAIVQPSDRRPSTSLHLGLIGAIEMGVDDPDREWTV